MSKKRRTDRDRNTRRSDRRAPPDDQTGEVLTVAWTVSVTAVLLADLLVAAAHFYVLGHPQNKTALAFEGIMLLSASVFGLVSLALLPVVWRIRPVKPPQGYVVFAVLVAVAPIVAVVGRLMQ